METIMKNKIDELRIALHQHNYNYYVLNAPTISDKEFDDMMKLMNKWGKKVIAAFAGHDHLDFVTEKNGVQHIQINSMAYCWPGKGYENLTRFPAETYEKYYILKYMWPYSDAIYGIVELDPIAHEIRIKGTKAEWMPPTPEAMGAKADPRRTSQVSDRLLKY
jgi:hypothetical protein